MFASIFGKQPILHVVYSSINFNKIICPYTTQVFTYTYMYVYAEGPQNLSNRSNPTAGRTMDKRARRGDPICFYRFFVSLFDFAPFSPAHRSVPGVSFTAEPLCAKLVNSSVTIQRTNLPPPIVPPKWSTINEERPSVCTRVLHR